MSLLLEPLVLVWIVVNTVMLGVLLAILRPGPAGYFRGYSPEFGWLLCLGVSVGFAILAIFQIPTLIALMIWFTVALTLFGLTVRQAFKLNIAQGLIYAALIFGLAGIAD